MPGPKPHPSWIRYYEIRVFLLWFILFWIPRIAFYLIARQSPGSEFSGADFLRAFGYAALFDVAATGFFLVPAYVCLVAFGPRTPRPRPYLFAGSALFAFVAVAEIVFLRDLGSRFNFIAVDYLVYTHEVIRNVKESYPVGWITAAVVLSALLVDAVLRRKSATLLARVGHVRFPRLAYLAIALLHLAVGAFVAENRLLAKQTIAVQELSKNGLFTLFAAFRNNEIDYDRFYATLPEAELAARFRAANREDRPEIFDAEASSGPPQRKNVVFVLMESMSAKFLAGYGGSPSLTPNLDRIAREGLWFSKVYATGTRTVRGIEATTLSLPPTPGQSIVRRPDSGGLYTIGAPFAKAGYRNVFVYGGVGYFDNMGPYFEANGFEVRDQLSFDEASVHFKNAWGVCDEDLFDQVIRVADETSAAGQPFFQYVLTTSNHRPYSYPDGKVALPSKSGREGAVQYSDYAIGAFLAKARTKRWFKDTVFVFVADHNASVAGGVAISVRDYLIPVLFYAPGFYPAKRYENLGSQMDVGPTLLASLGFTPERQRFFGQSLLDGRPHPAYLGTYQTVARYDGEELVLLKPKRLTEAFRLDAEARLAPDGDVARREESVRRTVAEYQFASLIYRSGAMKRVARGFAPYFER